MKQLTLT